MDMHLRSLPENAAVLAVLLWIPSLACSLALNLDDEQPCSTEADCVYSHGLGMCIDNVCRPPGASTGTMLASSSDDQSASGDVTTTPVTDTTTETGSGVGSATVVGCSVNSDCDNDQRCKDSTCVSLLSMECQTLQYADDVDRDNVVFLGSIYPTGEVFASLVQPLENASQLAIEDFNSETTLQGDRQIAWVGCDSTAGATAATNAAQHLIDNVGVPAIVGPVFSESVLAVANEVTIDAGVFLITPTASASSITALNDNELVWRTISPDVYQGNALVDRMQILADEDPGQDRLLVLAKDDAYGNGILQTILVDLENVFGAGYVYSASYPNPTEFASQEEMLAAYGAVLAGAFSDLPAGPFAEPQDHYTHVLIIGTSEAQSLLYAYVGTWNTYLDGDPDPALPLFTLSHGALSDMERMIEDIGTLPGTEELVPLKPTILASLQGTSPNVFDEQNFAAFNIRYRIRYNNQDAITSSALSYDAVLSTLFAMCTVDADDTITGARIAAAMPRLQDPAGAAISFSGQDLGFIRDARNALVVPKGSVDLHGVTGQLEWDDVGDIRTDILGWDLIDVGKGEPRLAATRMYVLGEPPATDGTWVDL